jgi:hypothetical protein
VVQVCSHLNFQGSGGLLTLEDNHRVFQPGDGIAPEGEGEKRSGGLITRALEVGVEHV